MDSIFLSLLLGNPMSYLSYSTIHPTDVCPAFYGYCVSATKENFNFILSTVKSKVHPYSSEEANETKVTQ